MSLLLVIGGKKQDLKLAEVLKDFTADVFWITDERGTASDVFNVGVPCADIDAQVCFLPSRNTTELLYQNLDFALAG